MAAFRSCRFIQSFTAEASAGLWTSLLAEAMDSPGARIETPALRTGIRWELCMKLGHSMAVAAALWVGAASAQAADKPQDGDFWSRVTLEIPVATRHML